MRDVCPIPLWTYPLPRIDAVRVGDSVPPLQVINGHAVIHGNASQRVAAADDVVTAVVVVTGSAIISNGVISAGDQERLTGIDIVGISHPRIRRDQRRE